MILTLHDHVGEPEEGAFGALGRKYTLYIQGIEIFTTYVYDTDGNGNWTEDQARLNGLRLFSHRVRRLVENAPAEPDERSVF